MNICASLQWNRMSWGCVWIGNQSLISISTVTWWSIYYHLAICSVTSYISHLLSSVMWVQSLNNSFRYFTFPLQHSQSPRCKSKNTTDYMLHETTSCDGIADDDDVRSNHAWSRTEGLMVWVASVAGSMVLLCSASDSADDVSLTMGIGMTLENTSEKLVEKIIMWQSLQFMWWTAVNCNKINKIIKYKWKSIEKMIKWHALQRRANSHGQHLCIYYLYTFFLWLCEKRAVC